MTMSNDDARVILAVAAEANDRFLWDRLKDVQAGMFAAGPVQIKFAYFGREGASQVRPCITTRWITDVARSWTEAEPIVSAAALSVLPTFSNRPCKKRNERLCRPW